jgi:predicted tellurium resistance membrane protein TerC
MAWLADPNAWIAFLTLVLLELVLGVDNVIFISILSGKLPTHEQSKARTTGIILAIGTRILLLLSLSWIIGLTAPLFSVLNHPISGRSLILIIGGLFLIGKSTHEIHEKLEGEEEHVSGGGRTGPSFASVILQILLLDVVFSLDSVITAVGMVDQVAIMIAAVIASACVMVFLAKTIGDFVNRHPTVKMLALSFLLLIGFTLIVEGLEYHIPKGYVYFAMAFSVFVEMLNLRLKKGSSAPPINLRKAYIDETNTAK